MQWFLNRGARFEGYRDFWFIVSRDVCWLCLLLLPLSLPPLKKLWLPLVLAGGLLVFFATGAHTVIGWQSIAQNYATITGFADANLAISALGFAVLYLIAVAFSLPVALFLTLTGGAVFGWLAAPLILMGATLGAGIVFIAARTIAREIATREGGEIGFNESLMVTIDGPHLPRP